MKANEIGLVVAIFLVLVLTACLDSNHNYLTNPESSIRDIARQASLLGIFSLGAAVVIIVGGQLGVKFGVRVISRAMQAQCVPPGCVFNTKYGVLPILYQADFRIVDVPVLKDLMARGNEALHLIIRMQIKKIC